MSLVERIKMKCKEQSTSMSALEVELGFGNGTLRRWDERIPGADRLLTLANRLDVSVDWLLTGKNSDELTSEERKLLNLYRSTNEIGQPLIMKHAEDTQHALPRSDRQPEQDESSASLIG